VSLLLLALSFCKFGSRAKDSGSDVSSFLDRSMDVRFSHDLGTEKCVISVEKYGKVVLLFSCGNS